MENANNDTLQEKMKDDIKNLIINKIYKDKKYIEEMTFNLVSKFNENVKNVFNSNWLKNNISIKIEYRY